MSTSITLLIKPKTSLVRSVLVQRKMCAAVCFTVQLYIPLTAYMHCSALPASDCSTRRNFSRQNNFFSRAKCA